LRLGYWASYNTPYFPTVRSLAGYDDMLREKPQLKDSFDYTSCARANIFRREQGKVKDFESYKHLMRLNQYQTDKLSKGNPSLAIASRKDLDPKAPDCRGATDAKVAQLKDIKGTNAKVITIVSGPTTDDQIPFDTYEAKCIAFTPGKYAFNGMPKTYNFGWTTYKTTLFDA
jgi:hypothetical protein